MTNNLKVGKIPTDLIIASFRGELSHDQDEVLQSWLSEETNQKKYDALKRVWDSIVSNAGDFCPQEGYGKFRRKVTNVWKTVAVAASAAAVIAVGFTLYNIYAPQTASPCTQTYACVTGKSALTLPDGSNVILHKGARISYDDSFSKTDRAVTLEGEAYFDVARDMENTFTVNIDDIDVVVHGTSFNVCEDSQAVTVSLVEGSVDIITESNLKCALKPGRAAVYDKETGSLVDGKEDVDFASCWARDRLTFTQASLGEVCRYLSKWYGVEIVVADALKSSCSYTFTIREEPIDQILDIMSRINPMKYLYTNDHRIIISEIH